MRSSSSRPSAISAEPITARRTWRTDSKRLVVQVANAVTSQAPEIGMNIAVTDWPSPEIAKTASAKPDPITGTAVRTTNQERGIRWSGICSRSSKALVRTIAANTIKPSLGRLR